MRRAVAVLALLAVVSSGRAHAAKPTELFAEGRIGAGADVIHHKGAPVAMVSLSPASLLVWSHNAGFALAYPFGKRNGVNASVGGILVRNRDEYVGTNLNFYTTLSLCGQRACLSFAHISHGRGVFNIREDAPNRGLNFLFLEYRYR